MVLMRTWCPGLQGSWSKTGTKFSPWSTEMLLGDPCLDKQVKSNKKQIISNKNPKKICVDKFSIRSWCSEVKRGQDANFS